MFKKVDKVLAALGNIKAMERLHVDTFTENKISDIDGDKIAESKEGQLYVVVEELNGYLFLETVILSRINIKTFKGTTLTFYGVEDDFILNSDTKEIESDYSNVSNRFMTRITFDITKEEIDRIKNRDYKQVRFSFKKKSLTLNKVS
ncbi:hypothetical protein [Aquimarina sp. MMG016]|uniref:hypothetical protein n=1 Tax=Aquimarina sp. MMG016 TaxID=2822690 RepID=UPI001B39D89F|nr:hypothetical protein [Aquimarina sp. MMG016]MBQ4821062.1 hypothetical protein [Aquimarina sp. MMG016]